MFDALNLTVQGKMHIKKGTPCQDASDIYVDTDNGYVVVAVADGHGSSNHFRSEVGSRMAVEASIDSVNSCFKEQPDNGELTLRDIWTIQNQKNNKYEDIDTILKNLQKNILYIWDEKINEYHTKHPLTQTENSRFSKEIAEAKQKEVFYGTTLVVAVMTKDYHFVIKIGDGNAVIVKSDGKVIDAIDDGELYVANRTASMCDFNAIDEFFHYFSKGVPLAILLSTDGLDRTFNTIEDFHYYNLLLVNRLFDKQSCIRDLERDFQRKNESGVGDDISLAIAYDMNQTDKWILNDLEKKRANLERRIKIIKDRQQIKSSDTNDFMTSNSSNNTVNLNSDNNYGVNNDLTENKANGKNNGITGKISEALSQVNVENNYNEQANDNMNQVPYSQTASDSMNQSGESNINVNQTVNNSPIDNGMDKLGQPHTDTNSSENEQKKKKIQLPTASIKKEVSAQIEKAIKNMDDEYPSNDSENNGNNSENESRQEASMPEDTYFSKPKKKKWFKRSEK